MVEALLARAKEGDTTAAGLLLARVCPALKPEGLPVELPGLDTGTLSARAEAALAAAGAGVIPPDAAAQLVQSVAGLARVVEVSELVARVEALEGKR